MMSLREYRQRGAALADFLPWAALVASGTVLNKDGSFQRTAAIRGPDLDSATPAELVATAGRLNSALRRLGSGWAIFFEAQRVPAQDYPASVFPDPASALVDRERRAQFAEQGAHFESAYFLTLQWMPPAEDAARAEGWLYEGRARSGVDATELLAGFADRSGRLLQLLEGFVPEARWLDDGETLTYLHSTVSTKRQRLRVSPQAAWSQPALPLAARRWVRRAVRFPARHGPSAPLGAPTAPPPRASRGFPALLRESAMSDAPRPGARRRRSAAPPARPRPRHPVRPPVARRAVLRRKGQPRPPSSVTPAACPSLRRNPRGSATRAALPWRSRLQRRSRRLPLRPGHLQTRSRPPPVRPAVDRLPGRGRCAATRPSSTAPASRPTRCAAATAAAPVPPSA